MSEPAVVRLRGVRKRYGRQTVLHDLSLEVQRGECFGLLGPNGAGKTTTMKLLTGRATLAGGRLEVFGLSVAEASRAIRQRVGVVTQDDTLDEELNCIRNLIVHAGFFGIDRREARARAERLLDFVQLSDRADARVTTLSGGMRRRLLIARALINEPELVLLDEPTTGLDPQARQNLWQKIRQLEQRGATILLTTHYMDEAEQLCDRLVVLDHGRVVAEGRPRDLIREHVGREVIEIRGPGGAELNRSDDLPLGELPRETHSGTLYVFLRDGEAAPPGLWSTEGIETLHRRATLEDVFLRLTGRDLRE
jgi:lipooligosaccharide transport system ATP-binding protein